MKKTRTFATWCFLVVLSAENAPNEISLPNYYLNFQIKGFLIFTWEENRSLQYYYLNFFKSKVLKIMGELPVLPYRPKHILQHSRGNRVPLS